MSLIEVGVTELDTLALSFSEALSGDVIKLSIELCVSFFVGAFDAPLGKSIRKLELLPERKILSMIQIHYIFTVQQETNLNNSKYTYLNITPWNYL